MDIEGLLKDSPLYYQDGDIEMRLVLVANIAVVLEWKCNDTWIEVSSMRPIAFNSVLKAYDRQRLVAYKNQPQ